MAVLTAWCILPGICAPSHDSSLTSFRSLHKCCPPSGQGSLPWPWKPRVEDIVADKPLLTMSSFQPSCAAAADSGPAQSLILPRQSARWSSAPWAGFDGGSVCSVVFIAVFPFIHIWEQPPSPRRCPSPPAAASLSMWSGHSDVNEGEGGPARRSCTKISALA